MKKFVSFLIALVLVCSFAVFMTSCNDKEVTTTNYPEDKTITVCSYNIRVWTLGQVNDNDNWNLRKPEFEKHLDSINADLYGMQEVTGFQRKDIRKFLEDYTHVGVCRETGKEDGIAESSSIFFRTERFDLLDSGNFWLSETPDEPSNTEEWGASCTRICSWVKLFDKWSGKSFLYYNTHLDHVSEIARVNSANLIMEKSTALDLPTILTGDFNANEQSQVYSTVTQQFDDTKYIADVTTDKATYNAWGNKEKESVIDFCFVSKNDFTASRYDVNIRTFPDPNAENPAEAATFLPSDHYPVVAKIKII